MIKIFRVLVFCGVVVFAILENSSTGFKTEAQTISPTTTPAVTPTFSITPTSIPTPNQNQIILSEVMACPESGQSEWVEFENISGQKLSFDGWSLKDNNTTIVSFNQINLEPNSFITSEISSKLNNSGDSVILLNGLNEIIKQMSYQDCVTGQSWIFHQNSWQQTSTPTFNAPNQPNTPTVIPNPTATINPTIIPTTTTTLTIAPTKAPTPSTKIEEPLPTQTQNFPFKTPNLNYDNKNEITTTSAIIKTNNKQPPTTVFANTPVQKTDIISVIIGGLTISLWGGYNLYVNLF